MLTVGVRGSYSGFIALNRHKMFPVLFFCSPLLSTARQAVWRLFVHLRNGNTWAWKMSFQQQKNEIDKLTQVLGLLRGWKKPKFTRARRRMSAAGRKRIAAAQRARWGKIKLGKK